MVESYENLQDKFYKLFDVSSYNGWTKERIATEYKEYTLEEVKIKLEEEKNYHERIEKNKQYKLFGDVDGYEI